MKHDFYKLETCLKYKPKKDNLERFYKFIISGCKDPISYDHALTEYHWIKSKCPYYKVWPGLVRYLVKTDLEKVPLESITLPDTVAFLFSKEARHFEFKRLYHLRSCLCHIHKNTEGGKSFQFFIDLGEKTDEGMFIFSCLSFTVENVTVGKALELANAKFQTNSIGFEPPEEAIENVVKCVIGSILICDGDELVEPDILNRDKGKPLTQVIINRANRRGKNGFNLGRLLETAPHYRGPSPLALYWTGPGRKVPKLRYRRGTIVHRKTVERIPTGHDL